MKNLATLLTTDYQYNIYEVDFPPLTVRLEDSLEFTNTDSILSIRFIKAWGNIFSLYNGQKSDLNNPEWTEDILVCNTDLSPYFENIINSKRNYIIKRLKRED